LIAEVEHFLRAELSPCPGIRFLRAHGKLKSLTSDFWSPRGDDNYGSALCSFHI